MYHLLPELGLFLSLECSDLQDGFIFSSHFLHLKLLEIVGISKLFVFIHELQLTESHDPKQFILALVKLLVDALLVYSSL